MPLCIRHRTRVKPHSVLGEDGGTQNPHRVTGTVARDSGYRTRRIGDDAAQSLERDAAEVSPEARRLIRSTRRMRGDVFQQDLRRGSVQAAAGHRCSNVVVPPCFRRRSPVLCTGSRRCRGIIWRLNGSSIFLIDCGSWSALAMRL